MNVYLVEAVGSDCVKIGIARNIEQRLAGLQTSCPHTLVVRDIFKGGRKEERKLHRLLKTHRVRGEWFRDCGRVQEIWAEFKSIQPPELAINKSRHGVAIPVRTGGFPSWYKELYEIPESAPGVYNRSLFNRLYSEVVRF